MMRSAAYSIEGEASVTGGANEGVRIGTAIVSYLQPHAGAELEFNRWYERDHFPAAVLAGPGAFSGARFVATRACKDARLGVEPRGGPGSGVVAPTGSASGGQLFGDPRAGSYLSIAWLLPGAQAPWDAWVPGQMQQLIAEDRMFAGRDHVHTAVYEHVWDAGSLDAPPASLALERGYAGVVAIAVPGADGTAVWARELVGPDLPLIVALRRDRLLLSVLDDVAPHVLLLAFTAADPIEVWNRVVVPALSSRSDIGFAGPFLATVPGTDTYVDQL
jgi:hypothetical protein